MTSRSTQTPDGFRAFDGGLGKRRISVNATADWQEVKSESQLSLKILSCVCVCMHMCAHECHNDTGNHSFLHSNIGGSPPRRLLFCIFQSHQLETLPQQQRRRDWGGGGCSCAGGEGKQHFLHFLSQGHVTRLHVLQDISLSRIL